MKPRTIICKKGYASKANRDAARRRWNAPVSHCKANEKNILAFFSKTLYKASGRAEQGV